MVDIGIILLWNFELKATREATGKLPDSPSLALTQL